LKIWEEALSLIPLILRVGGGGGNTTCLRSEEWINININKKICKTHNPLFKKAYM
jgi:hypothetical protein